MDVPRAGEFPGKNGKKRPLAAPGAALISHVERPGREQTGTGTGAQVGAGRCQGVPTCRTPRSGLAGPRWGRGESWRGPGRIREGSGTERGSGAGTEGRRLPNPPQARRGFPAPVPEFPGFSTSSVSPSLSPWRSATPPRCRLRLRFLGIKNPFPSGREHGDCGHRPAGGTCVPSAASLCQRQVGPSPAVSPECPPGFPHPRPCPQSVPRGFPATRYLLLLRPGVPGRPVMSCGCPGMSWGCPGGSRSVQGCPRNVPGVSRGCPRGGSAGRCRSPAAVPVFPSR